MSSLPDRLDHGSLPPAQLPSSRNPTSPGGTSLFGSRPGPSSSKPPPPLPEPAKQQSSSGSSTSSPRGRPALKSQLLMKPSLRKSHDGEKDERTSGSRDESSERGVFAMDVDYDEGSAMAAAAAMSSPVVDPAKPTGGSGSGMATTDTTPSGSVTDVTDGAGSGSQPLLPPQAMRARTSGSASGKQRVSASTTASSTLMPPPDVAVKISSSPRGPSSSSSTQMPPPPSLPMAEPIAAARKNSSGGSTGSRRASEVGGVPAEAPREKKPRRHGGATSFSAPNTPCLGPLSTSSSTAAGGTSLLGQQPGGAPASSTPKLGPQPMVLSTNSPKLGPVSTSKQGSKNGSKTNSPRLGPRPTPQSSPMLGPTGSPKLGPSSALVPLEADLQPHAMLRQHEFRSGRRVFHVHFGHGYVRSLEEPEGSSPAGPTPNAPLQPVEIGRSLSQTQNIMCTWDNPKYKQLLKLRAFYAVPKMVVIPSSQALRKQKLLTAVGSTPQSEAARYALIRQLLASGSVRSACKLVLRWQLQSTFPPAELIERLMTHKCYASAVRYARDFKVAKEHPVRSLLHRMLTEKRYEAALKQVSKSTSLVDGEMKPSDVIRLMIDEGQHAVALKYVHKFNLSEAFPPTELVQRALEPIDGELSVRTCAMLLKYVRLFKLEETYPMEGLLERIASSGITVHDMGDGKYVLKGRRRQVAQPGMASGGSTGASPGTSPSNALIGSGPS